MIVVTLTSWTKRIGNVKKVVESIMDNTVQPDRVYLNLSKTEFEGIPLPEDLVEYFNSDERLIINWVPGPNTKAMKKVFPILEYLEDDDIIIDADDDILFPRDLIECRLKDFENNGRKCCISSNPRLSVGFKGKMRVVSAMSLFQKKMFNRWKQLYTPAIIDTNNDDRTYLTILWLNGYLTVGCTKWSVQELLEKYDMSLKESSLTSSKLVKRGRVYDRIAQNEFSKISSKSILDSFGYW